MNISLIPTMLWLHVLALVGAFGVLLAVCFALPGGTRDSGSAARRFTGLLNALLGIGLAAGLAVFALKLKESKELGFQLGGGYHGVVGAKILILLAVGACLGLAPRMVRKGRAGAAHLLQTLAMGLLALAAFLGFAL